VSIWDTTTVREVLRFHPRTATLSVNVRGLSSDGSILAVESLDAAYPGENNRAIGILAGSDVVLGDTRITLFDTSTGEERGSLEGYEFVAFAPDSKTLIAQRKARNSGIELFDLPLRKPVSVVLGLWALAAIPFSGWGWWYNFRRRKTVER
jgi:hypothetical protein